MAKNNTLWTELHRILTFSISHTHTHTKMASIFLIGISEARVTSVKCEVNRTNHN